MISTQIGYECCSKFYYYGKHSYQCKIVNGMDADFSRGDYDIRNITIDQLTQEA